MISSVPPIVLAGLTAVLVYIAATTVRFLIGHYIVLTTWNRITGAFYIGHLVAIPWIIYMIVTRAPKNVLLVAVITWCAVTLIHSAVNETISRLSAATKYSRAPWIND